LTDKTGGVEGRTIILKGVLFKPVTDIVPVVVGI
jgi:hypothetical protein